MAVIPAIGNLVLPANISPASPATYEFVVDTFSQLAEDFPADGLTAAGSSISDATTNTALLTIPAANIAQQAVAGSVFYMRAAGILASPASGEPTLAFHAYSGGSSGTVLDSYVGVALSASLSATFSMFDVESWVASIHSRRAVRRQGDRLHERLGVDLGGLHRGQRLSDRGDRN